MSIDLLRPTREIVLGRGAADDGLAPTTTRANANSDSLRSVCGAAG